MVERTRRKRRHQGRRRSGGKKEDIPLDIEFAKACGVLDYNIAVESIYKSLIPVKEKVDPILSHYKSVWMAKKQKDVEKKLELLKDRLIKHISERIERGELLYVGPIDNIYEGFIVMTPEKLKEILKRKLKDLD